MLTDANKAVVRRSYQVYATGDLAVLDDVIAADYVDHNPVQGQQPGLAGVKLKVQAARDGLQDITARFHDQIAEGDRVASRLSLRARQPDGPDVAVDLIAISQLADGKIVAEWGIANTGGG